ncbi:divergent PAP2 family protein [uncultured Fusobacterium sp.]|jgi:acid phosphatase family membrane protein YuiD|uniref:divergent PAP2 family protein n=1 Tax=uncultured Fusobacterium sp. TaxID=159267 RepID=UPI0025FC4659|nr:divergent PAP2 family protein [uncultured Fusobacterium sp.]
MNPGIILNNRVLDVVFIAWFIAQFYKVLTSIFKKGKLDITRLWDTGGMPSSHSSTVSCLVTCIAIRYGINSDLFAITIIFAGIVMYDAAGIRRAAGKQAGVINSLIEKIPLFIGRAQYNKHFSKEKEAKLKELLGHTPFEVMVGCILGIIIGLLFRTYLQG